MKRVLATGSRNPDTFHTSYHEIVAHYVVDNDYVHPGKCLDELLDEQMGYHNQSDPKYIKPVHERSEMWELLVEVGAWTIEYGLLDEAREYDGEFDPYVTECLTCGHTLL